MDPLVEARRLFSEALQLHQRGEWKAAEAVYREALALAPGRPSILANLATVLYQQGRYVEAKAMCRKGLEAAPDDPAMLVNLGNCELRLESPGEALASFERVLAVAPGSAEAHIGLGNALLALDRAEEAIASLERATVLAPHSAEAHYNLGNALRRLRRIQPALASFDRALALRPDFAEAHFNRGNTLLDHGEWEAAIGCFERAVALAPGDASAHDSLAVARLYLWRFEEAWPEYEWRMRCPHIRSSARKSPDTVALYERKRRWRGPASGERRDVGIWSEQGIGDQILHSTLIPELLESQVEFTYEVDERLLHAYRRAFPGVRFVPLSDPPHEALLHAASALLAGSLPGIFRLSRESFRRQPRRLLAPLPERASRFRERLRSTGSKLNVALAWRSMRGDWLGREKGVHLLQFEPLFALGQVQFVSVQYGDTTDERRALENACGGRLVHFDDLDIFRDLEGVMALLEACDLLVTTSNASAHLAGAIGKRAWVLYPGKQAPFHYWAHDGSGSCLWYPSVEIVSGERFMSWRSLIEHVTKRLNRETSG